MDAKVYSIVGLPRRAAVDRAYIGLRTSDELVAKVLAVSEVAQIARAERRAREYLEAKWLARSAEAVNAAEALALKGRGADKITAAVDQIMERWAGDVEDAFGSEMDGIYRLARIAGFRKAATRSKASLQYNTTNFTEESVKKAKKTAKVVPNFDLADKDSMKALRQHQVFWLGDYYKSDVSKGIAQTAREVIVEAGGDRTKAGKLIRERMTIALGKVETPEGFHGSSKQYFEGLAANAATVARAHGQMRSFADIGISAYVIVNPDDERTCDHCGHMNGKVFKLKQGLDQMQAVLKAKNPKQVRAAHPWIGYKGLKGISSKAGAAGAEDADALAKAGQALPPFHFRCRCTADIDEEIGSWSGVVPMSAPTAEAESEPLIFVDEDEEQTDETRAADQSLSAMATGELKKRSRIAAKGVNASEIVELEAADGAQAKGVWKEARGEDENLRPNIEAGTYWKREELAYQVDRMMGPGGVVPPTLTREIENQSGSLQAFAMGAKKGDDVWRELNTLEQAGGYSSNASFRRTFVLDAVTGNDDRHGGNIMFQLAGKELKAVAIDNGLTFPEGPACRFILPGSPSGDDAMKFLKLDDASQKAVGRLKLGKLAAAIHKAGVKRLGARATLVRVQALQDNPEAIKKVTQITGTSRPERAVEHFIRQSAKSPEELVDEKKLKAIDAILDEVYK